MNQRLGPCLGGFRALQASKDFQRLVVVFLRDHDGEFFGEGNFDRFAPVLVRDLAQLPQGTRAGLPGQQGKAFAQRVQQRLRNRRQALLQGIGLRR